MQITNHESRTLYLCVLVIDSSGEMTIIFPHQWIATGESAGLEAGKTLLIPEPNRDSFNLQTQEPLGMTEILIIASVTPWRSSLKALQAIAQSAAPKAIAKRKNQQSGPVALSTPIEVIENLLADLARSNPNQSSDTVILKDPIRRVDTTQLAAMSITFEVS